MFLTVLILSSISIKFVMVSMKLTVENLRLVLLSVVLDQLMLLRWSVMVFVWVLLETGKASKNNTIVFSRSYIVNFMKSSYSIRFVIILLIMILKVN